MHRGLTPPPWIPETLDGTKPYEYYVFFLYIYAYDKTHFINQTWQEMNNNKKNNYDIL